MWENYVKSYERENVGDKNASQRGGSDWDYLQR